MQRFFFDVLLQFGKKSDSKKTQCYDKNVFYSWIYVDFRGSKKCMFKKGRNK